MNQLGLDDTQSQRINSTSSLASCPDCKRLVSYRAEICPACGLRLQHRPSTQPSVLRIAGGVLLGYLGILFINIVLGLVAFMFFAGALAAAIGNVQPNSSSSRPR